MTHEEAAAAGRKSSCHILDCMQDLSFTQGCKTVRELTRLWERQQGVLRECCTFLGEEFEGPFSIPAGEVVESSVDCSTRSKAGREKLMCCVLQQALLLYPDQTTYLVSSWKDRDKLSTAWLMSLPGPHYDITSPAFSEALARTANVHCSAVQCSVV